jgi:opacity protein-like surface antigen
MKTLKVKMITAALFAALASAGVTGNAFGQDDYEDKKFEATVLGGVQGLLSNDTAIPDDFVNVPVAASLAYRMNSLFALEGEFAWLIPVSNTVSVGPGESQDLKNPDVLTYQANLRANLPIGGPSFRPYLTGGAGAMTFLSTSEADRYPQLPESETAFAINFGLGANIPVTESLSLRGDFREFVAFPQDDAAGLSDGSNADPIWMPRGTFGVAYRF